MRAKKIRGALRARYEQSLVFADDRAHNLFTKMLKSIPILGSLLDRLAPTLGLGTSPLAFQTVQVFFARVGALFLGLLANLALTRWLGISAYGQYAYILAWITILTIPGQGMGTLVVRETAIARRREEHSVFKGLIRWSSLNTLWVSGALTLAGFISVFIYSAYLSRELPLAPLWGLAAIPLIYFQTQVSAVFRGCRRAELSVFLSETVLLAVVSAWAGSCLLFGLHASASMALAGRLVAFGVSLLAFALLLPRLNLPWHTRDGGREKLSSWRKSLFSFTLLRGVNITSGRLPVLILGLALGPEPVALFSLAARISEMVALALSIVIMTTGPRLAELHAKQDYRKMQRLVTSSTLATSIWAIPLTAGLILAGRWLLGFFGPRFVAGYPILVVLVIGQTINAITGTVSLVMTMGGLERLVLKVQALGLIMTAVLCLALIPVWGALGAALGAAIALIFWNVTLTFLLYRRLGIAASFYTPSFLRRGNATPNPPELDHSE